MIQYFILERIENQFAIVENDRMQYSSVPLLQIEAGAKEGDVLEKDEQGFYKINQTKTTARKQKLFAMQENLFSD